MTVKFLIEQIEADFAEDRFDADTDPFEIVSDAAAKVVQLNKTQFVSDEKIATFIEAMAQALYKTGEFGTPNELANNLSYGDSRESRMMMSYLLANKFAGSSKEVISLAAKVANKLHAIGDKSFPEEKLELAEIDEDEIWQEAFPMYWTEIVKYLVPEEAFA